eukprot:Skav217720  [mRNA]  locus=scaffold2294:330165:342168:- [translate_table: standard]
MLPELRLQYKLCEEAIQHATPSRRPSAEELAAYQAGNSAAQLARQSLLQSLPEECQQILKRIDELKKQARGGANGTSSIARKVAKRSAKDGEMASFAHFALIPADPQDKMDKGKDPCEKGAVEPVASPNTVHSVLQFFQCSPAELKLPEGTEQWTVLLVGGSNGDHPGSREWQARKERDCWVCPGVYRWPTAGQSGLWEHQLSDRGRSAMAYQACDEMICLEWQLNATGRTLRIEERLLATTALSYLMDETDLEAAQARTAGLSPLDLKRGLPFLTLLVALQLPMLTCCCSDLEICRGARPAWLRQEAVEALAHLAQRGDREAGTVTEGRGDGVISELNRLTLGCIGSIKLVWGMVVCAKCRQVPPNEGDTWCLGCSAWELIERELKSRWPGAQGLRQVAENLLVSAAREVRALRGISLGTSRPLEPAGAPPRAASAPARPEDTAGATAKSKAVKEEPESSASYYEDEESEEDRQAEQKEGGNRQGPSGAGSTGAPKEALARSSGHRGDDRGYTPRHRGDAGKEAEAKRRSRSKSLERKKRTRARSEEAEGDRRRRESGRTSGKKRKGKRAGRKHKRVGRVQGMTESTDRVWPEGEWVTCQSEQWRLYRAVIGDVLEIECSEVDEELGPGAFAAFIIEDIMTADDGGWLIRGRYLGASDPAIAKELAKKVSRMRRPLHLCWNQPCSQHGEVLDYVHVLEARWWSPKHFDANYLKPWARALISEMKDKAADGKHRPSKEKEKAPTPGKKRRPPKAAEPEEGKPSKKKKKGGDGPATPAGLRARLARVRERLVGHGFPVQPEVIDVDNGGALDGEYDEDLFGGEEPKDGLDAGDRLADQDNGTGLLAIEDGQVGEVKKEKDVKKKVKRLKKRVKRSPHALLLAQAEQKKKQGEEERRRKRRRRSRKGTEGKVRALVKALGVGSNRRRRRPIRQRRLGIQWERGGRGRGLFRRVGDDGTFTEEIEEEPGSGPQDAHRARQAGDGSELWPECREPSRDHSWSEAVLLLQPDGEALLPRDITGYERASSLSGLNRPAEGRRLGAAGRQLSLKVPGNPYGGERRSLEGSSIPGTSSSGTYTRSSHCTAFGGPKAWKAGEQKPRMGSRKQQELWRRECIPLWRQRRRFERKVERKEQGRLERKRKRSREVGPSRKRRHLVGREERWEGRQGGDREERGQGSQQVRLALGAVPAERKADAGEGLVKDPLLEALEQSTSMKLLGCCLAGILCRAMQGEESDGFVAVLRDCLRRGGAGLSAMHRCPSRDVFPIRLGELDSLVERLSAKTFDGEDLNSLAEKHAVDCWLLLSIAFCNSVHGYRCIPGGRWRKLELTAVSTMRASIERILRLDITLVRTPEEVEKELSSRFISYTGEEVPKMEKLTMAQIEPALPPKGHGGSIDVTSWTKGATRSFLLHPSSCIQDDVGQKLPPLTAKVHIVAGEEKKIAQLLVSRGICDWLPEEEVACYRNTRVLNGMFGVRKSSLTECGLPVLRVIMNFIPINGISVALSGKVQELPGVCQYMSITLSPNETILASQLDMTSAFYLFRMPASWRPYMCFSLALGGGEIGLDPSKRYHLCCGVLPMGWSSAVAIMQEVSDSLLRAKNMSPEQQVTRLRPLPNWMTSILTACDDGTRAWYHVYLDNFFSGMRAQEGVINDEDQVLQRKAEEAWLEAGVLSSSKKKVSGESTVEELGALIDGVGGILGGSPSRLLKLAQLTLLVVARKRVPAKWIQVVCGRWVHVLQFRRAGMVVLRWVWQWVAGAKLNRATRDKSRLELFWLLCGSCLLHTNLRAPVSPVASASDASSRGGAVGAARSLSSVGQDFVNAELASEVPTHPALVISLFNGVGGAFRTYDLCGVRPMGLISVEISKPANRVVGRRWPHALLLDDVRSTTLDEVRKWQLRFPHVEELHLWAGFPCVDLSRVRAGRQNLQGTQSGLFAEILRIQALLKRVFGQKFRLLFVIENVASMDTDALKELTQIFGVTPFYFQPSDAAPVSRPRVCWTNVSLQGLPGIILRKRPSWVEVIAKAPHPADDSWMTPGTVRDPAGEGAIYPTCMKSIARSAPPQEPAGLRRASSDAVARWRADSFRYPPYQYKSEYVLWSNAGWRLLNSSERELLHGLGWQHTSLCWSASDIKRDEVGYEDQRCSLVGDGFSMYSFVLVTWALCYRTMAATSYLHLCKRMGLAPGYCSPLERECPLARKLVYGSGSGVPRTVADLSRLLLGVAV